MSNSISSPEKAQVLAKFHIDETQIKHDLPDSFYKEFYQMFFVANPKSGVSEDSVAWAPHQLMDIWYALIDYGYPDDQIYFDEDEDKDSYYDSMLVFMQMAMRICRKSRFRYPERKLISDAYFVFMNEDIKVSKVAMRIWQEGLNHVATKLGKNTFQRTSAESMADIFPDPSVDFNNAF